MTGNELPGLRRYIYYRPSVGLISTLLFTVLALLLAEGAVGAGKIQRVSVNPAGVQGDNHSANPDISADGKHVAFRSRASNLVPGDDNVMRDIFVVDTETGSVAAATSDAAGVLGNGSSSKPSLSADGRYVAFYSNSSNLVPGDTNNQFDIFRKDLLTGEIKRLSVTSAGAQAYGNSYDPSISADGRYVVFYSFAANLVPGDDNWATDVFLSDAETGTLTVLSTGMSGGVASAGSAWATMSNDNRYVAFHSRANDIVAGDDNLQGDVFIKDLQTGVVTMASVGPGGVLGTGESLWASISGDGNYVAFESAANNLVPGDANGYLRDIFVYDRERGVLELISASAEGVQGNGESRFGSLSADGRYVVFQSDADNLVAGDGNGMSDVFVKDRKTGAVTMISISASGDQGDYHSYFSAISDDGRNIVFQSGASNLVPGDTNGMHDIFLAGMQTCKGNSKRCR